MSIYWKRRCTFFGSNCEYLCLVRSELFHVCTIKLRICLEDTVDFVVFSFLYCPHVLSVTSLTSERWGKKCFTFPPRLLPIPLVMTAHERAVRNMALCFLEQVTASKSGKIALSINFKNALDVWTFQLWRFTFYFIYIILYLCTNEFKATVR